MTNIKIVDLPDSGICDLTQLDLTNVRGGYTYTFSFSFGGFNFIGAFPGSQDIEAPLDVEETLVLI